MASTVSILGRETIFIGYGIEKFIVEDILSNVKSSTYVLIRDTNVNKFEHVAKLEKQFSSRIRGDSEVRLLKYLVPPGEMSKSRETKAQVEDWLLSQGCTRDVVILAVGGGIIGDMIGYVAATFMRGVRFIQIPTTLLAMVDSSIGGKTAIDTPHGKNLIGAFWQPSRIYIELEFLESLPLREFINGMAEVIKTAAIYDEAAFTRLEEVRDQFFEAVTKRDPQTGCVDLSGIKNIVFDIVRGSARVKADVVTKDEREGGLRNILNFGHSIGHAYEAVLTPQILHGECVAIGMVLEAELSRHLGHMSPASVARLIACIKNYQLPTTYLDPVVQERSNYKQCRVDDLLGIMNIDKKNDGAKKKVVLLGAIGKTYEPKATVVSDEDIRFVLTDEVLVGSGSAVPKEYTVIPPGSKSISNRVLLLASLGSGTCTIRNLLHSDDTGYMIDAVQRLGAANVEKAEGGDALVIAGGSGKLRAPADPIYLGNAGTATRFLSCLACFVSASPDADSVTVTGNKRMQQRPIGPLVDALVRAGADINYLGNPDCPPIQVKSLQAGQKFRGGRIELAATISSQYVSAILMCAPYSQNPVTLALIGGKPISQFYIDMTIHMMADFGIVVEKSKTEPHTYHIPVGTYKNPSEYLVESDASSATYPLALAALTGTRCHIPSIGAKSLQGDAQFATDVLNPMGCVVEQTETSTTVQGPPQGGLKALKLVDMEPMTDAFMTACVVAAVASGTTRIEGIANQRVKESNRIEVMRVELAKFGVVCREHEDGIEVDGVAIGSLITPRALQTYDDHRIAMSLSLLATQAGQPVLLEERRCVSKTWPGWWDVLRRLHVPLKGVEIERPVVQKKMDYRHSIVVIGMRGAGKTSLSKTIGTTLGWPVVDIDDYIESSQNQTIPEIIHSRGWQEFRHLEFDALKSQLERSKTVIACGGGVVETEACRKALKAFMAMGGLVVNVHRNLHNIVSYLQLDKTRPAYVDDIAEVYHKRKRWYSECSNVYFFSRHVTEVHQDAGLRRSLSRFLQKLLHPRRVSVPKQRSYFLSLTYPDLSTVESFGNVTEGCDAVELRVDLLKSWEPEFVAEQVALLRARCDLPIIFTVRTESQGGKFPNHDVEYYAHLVGLAFKMLIEYVDLEMSLPESLLTDLVAKKGATLILASHHDISGKMSWDDREWRVKYQQALRLGDVIKLVGSARTFEDNFALEKFRDTHTGPSLPPLIAINMGYHGRMSRVLNTTLTPVTHKSVPFAAAPGQLTVQEINHLLAELGGLAPKSFFVCGEPITHSPSPDLHNASFQALGLPYDYSKFSTGDVAAVAAHIKKLGTSFGGASVTIPLKQDVIPLMGSLTEDAAVIGAINTITPLVDGSLQGSNTDWLGIKNALQKFGLETVSPQQTAAVLGAGGTAMAAIYALKQLGFGTIYVVNRTTSKAHGTANRFGKEYRLKVVETDADIDTRPLTIISTIPGDREIPEVLSMRIKDLLSANPGVTQDRYLLEASYKPSITHIMKLAEASGWITIPGREMLVLQGVEQDKIWTGISAQYAAEKAVL